MNSNSREPVATARPLRPCIGARGRCPWRGRLKSLLAAGLLAPCLALAGNFVELKPVSPSPAPALSERPGGPEVLDSLRGRPVVVNFWATWCEPCRDEMPALDRLRGRRPDVAVITVAMADSKAKVDSFITDYLLDLRVLHDPDQVAGKAWGVRVLPTTIVLDAAHRVRYRAVGVLDWDSPALGTLLDGLKTPRP